MVNKGLGRGFEGLIPTGFSVDDVATPGEHVKQLPVVSVVANPDQPRKEFDIASLNELAQSIKQHGIIQPLVVTPYKDKFRIVAGERRFRAALIAKLEKIPAIIRNHEKLEELEIALVENVQRVDLSPLEQAISVAKLRDEFSLSLKQISKKLGKAETTVSNIIRLLHLPKKAIEALQKNKITEGHARAILALKTDEKLQIELLNKIITQKLSVRAAEQFVKDHRAGAKVTKKIVSNVHIKRISKLEKQLGFPVNIISKKRGGSLQIKFKSDKELEAIIENLENKGPKH